MKTFAFFIVFTLLLSCKNETAKEQFPSSSLIQVIANVAAVPPATPTDTINRNDITIQLKNKIVNKDALLVHVLVPLCDNENQGIVPVPATLGNGKNPKSNLYWGALYGVKTYFKNNGWKIINTTQNISDTILERIVFEKIIPPATKVIVIADAYSGDKMENCLQDFFNNLNETLNDTVKINDTVSYNLNNADLVAFTGHNGLMDVDIEPIYNKTARQKDAVVLACVSFSFFGERLNYLNAYPLITTKSLMAPEAYVLDAVINSWAKLETVDKIYTSAITAYSNYQKCSLQGARSVFKTGW